ncbi:MAG TPA: universal stress protein [Myxococcales bacterium]|nr:universal stress protein [Myxococcales bacterium]
MASFESILVPTDFSAGSYAALGYAVFLGQRIGSTIEVLAVYEAPVGIDLDAKVTQPGHAQPETLSALLRETTEKKLKNFLSDIPGAQGLTLRGRIEQGNPAEVIVRAARSGGVDLVCMGTKGLGSGNHGPVGSVVEKVIRDAPCPVLAVRVKEG